MRDPRGHMKTKTALVLGEPCERDFDNFQFVQTLIDLHRKLSVNPAHPFVPDAEFMLADGKFFNSELPLRVGLGCIRMVEDEPPRFHPGMDIALDGKGNEFRPREFKLDALSKV